MHTHLLTHTTNNYKSCRWQKTTPHYREKVVATFGNNKILLCHTHTHTPHTQSSSHTHNHSEGGKQSKPETGAKDAFADIDVNKDDADADDDDELLCMVQLSYFMIR